MAQVVFKGVKNQSKIKRVLQFDSNTYEFASGEVKILPEDAANHACSRTLHVTVDEKTGEKGYFGFGIPFIEIPLTEALKVAKLDDNPSIRRARDEAEAQEKREKALRAKIIAEVKAEIAAEGNKKVIA